MYDYKTFAPVKLITTCKICLDVGNIIRLSDNKTMLCPTCHPRPKFHVKHHHVFDYASMTKKDNKISLKCTKCPTIEVHNV